MTSGGPEARGAVLVLEQQGRLATLWLDQPPRNPTNYAFFSQLARLVREELARLALDGLVVRGRGRHFSSGADVMELKRHVLERPRGATLAELHDSSATLLGLERLPYPVIAAVDGCCLGSGLELALACRYRLATPSALFALPELSFDLMPGCGATVRLPRLVGIGRALDLIFSGRTLTAEEARAWGLIDAVVPRAELGESAYRLARRLTGHASAA